MLTSPGGLGFAGVGLAGERGYERRDDVFGPLWFAVPKKRVSFTNIHGPAAARTFSFYRATPSCMVDLQVAYHTAFIFHAAQVPLGKKRTRTADRAPKRITHYAMCTKCGQPKLNHKFCDNIELCASDGPTAAQAER